MRNRPIGNVLLLGVVLSALGCVKAGAGVGGGSEGSSVDEGSGQNGGPSGSTDAGDAPGCFFDGKTYAEGESVPASVLCQTCRCEDGDVVCVVDDCADASRGTAGGGQPDETMSTCGGFSGGRCSASQYCNYSLSALCGAADATGICTPKPSKCTKEYGPVCGCDGKMYGNTCAAAAAGTSVSKVGSCH